MTTIRNLLGATALGVGLMFGFGAPQEAEAGIVLLSDVSSDETPASVLDARFEFEVSGNTLELTVFNLTSGSNEYKINEVYFNSTDNITGLTLTAPTEGWSYETDKAANGVGNFGFGYYDHALIDGVGTNPAQIGSGGNQLFTFTIASLNNNPVQADFLAASTQNGLAAAKFVQGPGDDSAFGAAVVPVPAALPLLLTALGALGLIGRKKMMAA